MRRVVATLVLLTVALVACGDDSDEAEPSRNPPTSAAAPAGSGGTEFSGAGSERFCGLARGYRDNLDRLSTTDPTQLKTLAQDAEKAIKEAVATAPAEIKGDVQVVAAASTAFFQQLGRVNYDITKLSPDSLSGLQKPEVQASTQRVTAYTEKVCGITPPSVP